ncbi:hypothetical protein GCM10022291_20570 [Postechiella marina]|uniref:Lipoprotein n=1 Tax=Postechiella marina TaxID=943941 RepID=A0ABP8CA05_9FLAO
MKFIPVIKQSANKLIGLFGCIALLLGCNKSIERPTFAKDLEFLSKTIQPIILKDSDARQIIVSAEFQGKIMTSTSNGLDGASYGWFNKGIIASDTVFKNRSKVGSAGRIWFGPDQGPNTVFFKRNKVTNKVEHATPKDLDTLPFKVYEQTKSSVILGNTLHLENLKGFHFYINVKRSIEILSKEHIERSLNLNIDKTIGFVGFKSITSMKNIGETNWSKNTGLLSLWDLGCFYPTPKTTVVIPLKGNKEKATVYFTPIDSTRLKIKENILFYKADANYLNKIGTLPEHTIPYFGSYSPEFNLLTIIKFSFQGGLDYVNAHPEHVSEQYRGDVINVFNDGKLGDIGPFGPFYELETSSAAKALKVGESIYHTHETYHFEGSKQDLNAISKSLLNVGLDTVNKALH